LLLLTVASPFSFVLMKSHPVCAVSTTTASPHQSHSRKIAQKTTKKKRSSQKLERFIHLVARVGFESTAFGS
jgi:hypothetical protein